MGDALSEHEDPCLQCLDHLLGQLEDRDLDDTPVYLDRDMLDEAAAVIRQLLEKKRKLLERVALLEMDNERLKS